MLAAILAGFLFYFGFHHDVNTNQYIDNLQQGIQTELSDKAQKSEALAVIKKMKEETKIYFKSTKESSASLVKELTKEQIVPDAEFASAFDQLNTDRATYQKKMLALRGELKKKISRDNWEKIFTAAGKEIK